MLLILLLLGEMMALFFLSRWVNAGLFHVFYRLSHSEHVAVSGTTLLLFPGTVVHELSHLFVAEILGVKTGKLSLVPEFVDEDQVQAGSVEVAKTDPFRRTIIGIAPLLTGIIVVTLLSSYLASLFPTAILAAQSPNPLTDPTIYIFTLAIYLLFSISNNMFPSKEDMRGVPAVLILLALIIGTAYVVGVRFALSGNALTIVESIFSSLTTNLVVVIVLNVVLWIIVQGILRGLRRR